MRGLWKRSLLTLGIIGFLLHPASAGASTIAIADTSGIGNADSGMIIWDGTTDVLTMGFFCSLHNTPTACNTTALGSVSPALLSVLLHIQAGNFTFSQVDLLLSIPGAPPPCAGGITCETVSAYAQTFKPGNTVCWNSESGSSSVGGNFICNPSTDWSVAILPLVTPAGSLSAGSTTGLSLTAESIAFLTAKELAQPGFWQGALVGFDARFVQGVTAGFTEEAVGGQFTMSLAPTAVPEPGTLALLGSGIVALASRSLRRRLRAR